MQKRHYKVIAIILCAFWHSSRLLAQPDDPWSPFTLSGEVKTIHEDFQGDIWVGTTLGLNRFDESGFKAVTELGSNEIVAIIDDRLGNLWVGTTSQGAFRYDGDTWTPFTTANGLASNSLTAILEDSAGNLWFGTLFSGVSRYDGTTWTTFTTANGLVSNRITIIFKDRHYNLWIGTSSGLSRFDGKTWTSFTTTNGLASNDINVIVEDRRGRLWAGTSRGLSLFDGTTAWAKIADTGGPGDNPVNAIIEDRGDTLWVGTANGANRFDGKQWVKLIRGLSNNDVRAILQDSHGDLWFGTWGGGVYRFDGRTWTNFTYSNTSGKLVDNYITKIFEDSQGDLWFGVQYGGVSRYDIRFFETYTTKNGLAADTVYSITEANLDIMGFGTARGVSLYNGILWKTFTKNDGLAENRVTALFEDGKGKWRAGTHPFSINHLQDITSISRWNTLTTLNKFGINAIIEDRHGSQWFATSGLGAIRLDGNIPRFFLKAFFKESGPASDFIQAILEDSSGNFWFGTSGGLTRFDGRNWETFTTDHGLADNYVTAIIEDHQGMLWIGTLGGISRFDGGSFITFTIADGLVSNFINAIAEDDSGTIWVGTDRGISRYVDNIWHDFLLPDGSTITSVNVIFKDRRGKLWFGTSNGVTQFRGDRVAPKTTITPSESLTGNAKVQFNFEGKDNWMRPNRLLYSTKVVRWTPTFDEGKWSEPPVPFPNSIIDVGFPTSGTYTVYIRATDEFGNEEKNPARRTITVDLIPPTVMITSPKHNEVVAGKVALVGSAFDSDFENYTVQYGLGDRDNPRSVREWKDDRISLVSLADSIFNNTLAFWDATDLPNGAYWLRLSASDTFKHAAVFNVLVRVITGSLSVVNDDGAHLETGSIEIYIPPRADAMMIDEIEISECAQALKTHLGDSTNTFAGPCFEIAPDSLLLKKPGTIKMIYSDTTILKRNINERNLAIYYSPDGESAWTRLGGSVDSIANKIATGFTKAGVYAVFESESLDGAKAGIFKIAIAPRVLYPQENPVYQKYGTTSANITFELGKKAEVTIKVFNLSGRLVCTLADNQPMNSGSNVVSWNGRDDSGRFCLSGLYTVVIRAGDLVANKTMMVMNR